MGRKTVIGTFSLIAGIILLMDSIPGITGYVISDQSGFNLFALFGIILLGCGLALFVLEGKERQKS